jgi:hypothetical protein
MSQYTKNFEDELDWNMLSQLHNVVLQISGFTFRIKEVCLTVEIGVMGLLFKLTHDSLDPSVFIAGIIIPVCFWFLDSTAYYYQVKLRSIMDKIQERLRERNTEKLVYDNKFQRVIEKERSLRPQIEQWLASFFNQSMLMYYILIIVVSFLWYLFSAGVIS